MDRADSDVPVARARANQDAGTAEFGKRRTDEVTKRV
jgi:hypothetical protein